MDPTAQQVAVAAAPPGGGPSSPHRRAGGADEPLSGTPPAGIDPPALHAALHAQLPLLYCDLLLGFDEVRS